MFCIRMIRAVSYRITIKKRGIFDPCTDGKTGDLSINDMRPDKMMLRVRITRTPRYRVLLINDKKELALSNNDMNI